MSPLNVLRTIPPTANPTKSPDCVDASSYVLLVSSSNTKTCRDIAYKENQKYCEWVKVRQFCPVACGQCGSAYPSLESHIPSVISSSSKTHILFLLLPKLLYLL